jgi:hypothetical protein
VDQARLRYADAVVRYNQAQVNLLAAVGVIDEENLIAGGAAPGTAPTKPATRGGGAAASIGGAGRGAMGIGSGTGRINRPASRPPPLRSRAVQIVD